MKEEISRILQMLEEGKVSADEAERLIKTLQETSAAKAQEDEFDPLRDIRNFFKSFRSCVPRHRAHYGPRRWSELWQYRQARKHVVEARERASRMSVEERVRFVLQHRAYVDRSDFDNSARLGDLLDFDSASWDPYHRVPFELLRAALELEFDRDIPEDHARAWQTVQDVIDYLDSKKKAK